MHVIGATESGNILVEMTVDDWNALVSGQVSIVTDLPLTLRGHRIRTGRSLRDLAKLAGVSASQLSRIERGRGGNVGQETVSKILGALAG